MSDNADTLVFDEMVAQPYQNCRISAGFVEGHPVDTLYLKLERPPEEPYIFVLRPDEAAAIAWCLTGTLYSDHMRRRQEDGGGE